MMGRYLKMTFIVLAMLTPWAAWAELPYQDPGLDVEARVADLLSRMTMIEKFDQLSGITDLGNLVDYGHLTFDTPDNHRLGIPGFRFCDGPKGVSLGKSTCFPAAIARGASWDPDLEERVGIAMGREAKAHGANLYGAPCMNVIRHPGWGRSQETYGADPWHIGMMGSALITGLQDNVMACAKHFAANSIENTRMWVNILMDERTLREVYLPHFKMGVDAGVASVMSAYNKLNGAYCSENSYLLNHILKEEWQFDGFVVSDFVFGVHSTQAINAGLDLEMPLRLYFSKLALFTALWSGQISMDRVDESVSRILRAKFRFGLFDNPLPEQQF